MRASTDCSNQKVIVRKERHVVVRETKTERHTVNVPGPQGPPGDIGPQGPPGQDNTGIPGPPGPAGKDGQIRFTGYGPPSTIVGSEPGDTYMDLATGDVYKLI